MTTTALPGFDSPVIGFEQPFEMLEACHDRVRRSLALLGRLIEHIDRHGHDDKSRGAASDVLRYFDIAAPLHHQDEERHVFPMLADSGDQLSAAVAGLRVDHERMEVLWGALRVALIAWSGPDAAGEIGDDVRAQASRYEQLYGRHLLIEENLVFPASRAQMDSGRLGEMSVEMQRRRRGTG